MRYIVVNRCDLSVTIQSHPGEAEVTIPMLQPFLRGRGYVDHPVSRTMLEVLHEHKVAEYAEDEKHVAFSLVAPDPWLVTLGVLMWEGILQGLTWDVVKSAVLAAIERMRAQEITPPTPAKKRRESGQTMISKTVRISKIELGFSWVEYLEGEKQREMFLGLRRHYRNQQRRKKRADRPD